MIKKEVMGFDSATDKNSRFAATATLGKIYIFCQFIQLVSTLYGEAKLILSTEIGNC